MQNMVPVKFVPMTCSQSAVSRSAIGEFGLYMFFGMTAATFTAPVSAPSSCTVAVIHASTCFKSRMSITFKSVYANRTEQKEALA